MIKWEKSLCLDISMFDSLRNKGDIVASIINDVIKGIIIPLDFKLEAHVEKIDGGEHDFKVNQRNLEKIYTMLNNGEIRNILINYVAYPELLQPEFAISFTCDYSYGDYLPPGILAANNMFLSFNLRLFNGYISSDIQNKVKDFFINAFGMLNGIVGYIDLDFGHATIEPDPTRYECELGYYSFVNISNSFNEKARGVFWGNMLTKNHIEKLGGFQNIKKEMPFEAAEEYILENGNEAVFLQLTPDINSCDEEVCRKAKSYLKPILPT